MAGDRVLTAIRMRATLAEQATTVAYSITDPSKRARVLATAARTLAYVGQFGQATTLARLGAPLLRNTSLFSHIDHEPDLLFTPDVRAVGRFTRFVHASGVI
jgi:hypothetical protein